MRERNGQIYAYGSFCPLLPLRSAQAHSQHLPQRGPGSTHQCARTWAHTASISSSVWGWDSTCNTQHWKTTRRGRKGKKIPMRLWGRLIAEVQWINASKQQPVLQSRKTHYRNKTLSAAYIACSLSSFRGVFGVPGHQSCAEKLKSNHFPFSNHSHSILFQIN